jgi:hypothetical protein
LCLESGRRRVYNTRTAEKVSKKETPVIPRGETMLLSYRAVLPTLFSPRLTPPSRKRHHLNTLEVVFSTTGDPIRVHSHGDHCSASWDAALSYGHLEPDRGDGPGVSIWPDGRAWLDKIQTLAAGWMAAVNAGNRSCIARAATRIQRYDDRSDGMIDLVIAMPLDRRW